MSFSVYVDDGSGKVDAFLAEWVRMRIPRCEPFKGSIRGIGICRGDALVAAAIYTDMVLFKGGGGNVFINFAADAQAQPWRRADPTRRSAGIKAPHWATRQAVSVILTPPFMMWGCTRITAIVDKDFRASRKLLKGVGFKEEGAVRRMLPGNRDAVIHGLLRDEFLGGRFAPRQPAAIQQAA